MLVRKVREIGGDSVGLGVLRLASVAQDDGGVRVRGDASPDRTGEEDQIAIGIYDDEGCGAPGFLLEGLMEGYVQGLIAQKELFDLVCAGDSDRGGEQVFAFPYIASEYRLVDVAQGKPRVVASDLPVKRWIAIDEIDGEAEPNRTSLQPQKALAKE
jgi:hypothetical protein